MPMPQCTFCEKRAGGLSQKYSRSGQASGDQRVKFPAVQPGESGIVGIGQIRDNDIEKIL